MDIIRELLATTEAVQKLGARAVLIVEAQQLLDSRYVIVRNPRRGRSPELAIARRLNRRENQRRRTLTLVVERTREPTTWLIVTGWEATARQRKLLDS